MVSLERTDSPGEEFNRSGFYSREALWEDLRLDYLVSVPGRPGGFMFFVAADLRLPTSKFSRSRQRWFTLTFRADGLYASTRDKRAATAESGAGIKEL
jgi:hypothetical protein